NVRGVITEIGANLMFVYHQDPFTFGRPSEEMRKRKELTLDDAEAIAELPHVKGVNAELVFFNRMFGSGTFSVKYEGRKSSNVILAGETHALLEVTDLTLHEGRWFSPGEDQEHAHVIVLGHDVDENLFPKGTSLGKEINIEGELFTVVGVINKRKAVVEAGP